MKFTIPLALLASLLCACSSAAKKDADMDVPDFEQSEWLDAVRMSNGTVNLTIVPSIGRVMRYGFAGEPNLLWTNPNLTPNKARADAATRPTWRNFGGEKVWLWPQEQWPQRIGRAWPPPVEVDQRPVTWKMHDPLHITMTSEPVQGYGVRVIREIKLAPTGTRVTMNIRCEVAGEQPADDVAVWSIAQIPSGETYARLLGPRGHRGLEPAPWDRIREISPRVIALEPPTDVDGKIGLDADTLAWVGGSTMLVQHSLTAAQHGEQFKPVERAQVYFSHPRRNIAAKVPQYLEFEWTSPRVNAAAGEIPELRVIWELHQSPRPWTDQSVAQFLSPQAGEAPNADDAGGLRRDSTGQRPPL